MHSSFVRGTMQPVMRDTGVDLFLSRAILVADPFYQEFSPPPDLVAFVACTWVRVVRCAGGSMTDAILPDGCADIMVAGDRPPVVAGPDAVTRRVTLPDGQVITGIRMRPGACRAILGCPAGEIVNGGALLSDIAPGGHDLHRRLIGTGDLFDRLALLEDWVRGRLHQATDNDRAVIAACRMLGAGSMLDVGAVARKLDWNVRMIHRQFVAACGYSPKHFQRIMRIQQVLRLARGTARGRLAGLAAAAGYADQPHMTRDFREITGFTPSAYFASAAATGWGEWIEGW
jgi:AraC-like DNA-binding protein